MPKCIVHGAGGTLLKHLSEQQLHSDVRPGDRLFYFTTCGWMMWNWLASGLASGATLAALRRLAVRRRTGSILFDYADAERMTLFGTSAKFIDECKKRELAPARTHKLATVRAILSTGSPLVPESFDYVYASIKNDVCLSSISGGTDIIGCFVLGNPILPVWRGEIQCRALGTGGRRLRRARASRCAGRRASSCAPSRSRRCRSDSGTIPTGKKYRAAYFERFPNVWCHGDYVELTEHDGMVIYGRSDAVLNPGGVRIGTAEIYRQVEQLDEVLESLVIGQDWPRAK